MQGLVSDKTFHLKWNNHLQNLSQLFTTIYSSSALADVTLSCRDGMLKAHKLVLSACSPYFEQIFKDNPCQHPIVILKGIPFSEINLLVEFMYKGSVDVQELDLQSLMHTASELEIRGLAYEARDNAAQLLNVNLEYPAYPQSSAQPTPPPLYQQAQRTDVERLKQIHLYQQSMMRAEEVRRRREEPARTHAAVTNILAAAAREMEEARHASRDPPGPEPSSTTPGDKRRASCLAPASTPGDVKKKAMTVRFQDDAKPEERDRSSAPPDPGSGSGAASGSTGGATGAASNAAGSDKEDKPAIKVVQLCVLQKGANNEHTDSDEKQSAGGGEGGAACGDDEETDSSGSMSDSAEHADARPHVCEVCDLRFQRSSHLSRHRLTHTGERPYTCGGCGRSFARSDKLRVHTKICEKEDPTVELAGAGGGGGGGAERRSELTSGMVRATHRDSTHLVFTPGGDVMLPPRATDTPTTVQATPPDHSGLDPPRRGRGRPRKTPLPMTPKIKKRRGRPPKTSLDMEGCVLTGGTVPGGALTAHHQLLLKRRRGRPPKNYFLPRTGAEGEALPVELGLADLAAIYGRPNENYNATNLPFGDFSYLTDMMYNPLAYYGAATQETDRTDDHLPADTSHDRTIDVSDSSSSESEGRAEGEEGGGGGDTQIMTVGDCQIVKLPPAEEQAEPAAADSSTGSAVTITPISTVGDCTIRPLDTA